MTNVPQWSRYLYSAFVCITLLVTSVQVPWHDGQIALQLLRKGDNPTHCPTQSPIWWSVTNVTCVIFIFRDQLSPTLDGYVEQAGDRADDNLVRARVTQKQRDVSLYTQNLPARVYFIIFMEFNRQFCACPLSTTPSIINYCNET